jgi:hypothetical protein
MGSTYCYSLLVNISTIELYSNGPSKVAAQSNKYNKNYYYDNLEEEKLLLLLLFMLCFCMNMIEILLQVLGSKKEESERIIILIKTIQLGFSLPH